MTGSEHSFNISVIIPTYNRAHYLNRVIKSVFNQSYLPPEVIVVDDGSKDNSSEIIQRNFKGVKYIWQENRGPSAARNKGIIESKGEWLALLDSDDEWLPKKLERQIKALANSSTSKICYTNEIWIKAGKRVNPKKRHEKFGGLIFHKCLPLCIISPSSVLIHRSVFDEVGLFDESLTVCEDYDLWLRISAKYPVLFLDEPLIKKYGGHGDQLSKKYWGMDRFRIYALEKLIRSGELTQEQLNATTEVLLHKIKILKQGSIKRNKKLVSEQLQKKEEIYLNLFKNTDTKLINNKNNPKLLSIKD
jgi:glycosyltransferase involved in cell wall biosynthesis